MSKNVLGRGLGALIADTAEEPVVSANSAMEIEISKIRQNRYQPRVNFKEEPLRELMASIQEKGIIQPIIVRKKDDAYHLVAGERRLRAAKALGMEKVPVIVKDISDEDSFEVSLIENIQRENLNPIEEANAYQRLINEFKLSQEAISEKVGKDRATVANSLRLLNLPVEIQEKITKGELSTGHAKVLLGVESEKDQKRIALQIVKQGLSVRQTEKVVAGLKEAPINKERMGYKDTQLIAVEEHIQRVLGTKVNICQGKKKGKIEIEYYTKEDLDRLLDYFGVDKM